MITDFKLKDVDFEVFGSNFTYKILQDYDHKPISEELIKNDMGGQLIIAEFEGPNFNLIFQNEDEKPLTTIEIAEPDLMLFGENIIGKNIDVIKDLLKKNNHPNFEIEDFPWGETGLTLEEEGVDFYFENKNLIAVSIHIV